MQHSSNETKKRIFYKILSSDRILLELKEKDAMNQTLIHNIATQT